MTSVPRWTSADLDIFPDHTGKRYEIIAGDLYVSKQPDWHHQAVCGEVFAVLRDWSRQTGAGVPNLAPGLIFTDDEDVAPDVIWISRERLTHALEEDGKLHDAPELAVEVLSPGKRNEERDKDAKLKLYSRRGVSEYWIVDWRKRTVAVYRREQALLRLVETLYEQDDLRSPLLPGFVCRVGDLFAL
jgi:Uma2 family endonuclease